MKPLPVIGVDVGGTKVLAAVVAPDGTVGRREERPSDLASSEALLAEIDRAVEDLRSEQQVAALGFGLPSLIDQRRGRAVSSVNLPLQGVDFRDRMSERHGLPVAIDNDANAAAIGEWRAGAARPAPPPSSATSSSSTTGPCAPAAAAATSRRSPRALRPTRSPEGCSGPGRTRTSWCGGPWRGRARR